MEENNLPYFPTNEECTQVREPPKVVIIVLPPLWATHGAQRGRAGGAMTQTMLPWQNSSSQPKGPPLPSQEES